MPLNLFLLALTDFVLLTCLYFESVPLVMLHYLLLLYHLCFDFLNFVMLLHLCLPVTLLCLFYRTDTLESAVERCVNVVQDCLLLCLRCLVLCLFHCAVFFLC